MILFLDFDGVTHPIPCKDEAFFCHLERIEGVLRDYPDVKVVISSWWRASHTLEALRDFFSDDIGPRIIGVTPWEESTLNPDGIVIAKSRYDECLAWMAENGYTGPWVALDDAWREFPAACPQLVGCHTDFGFDSHIEKQLREYLLQAIFNGYPPVSNG